MREALLLLPGLLCDETVWRAQIEGLRGDVDVVVADYGDADSLGEMARRAIAGAPQRFSVAGHSMGARVALEIVRMAHNRVRRLALLSTGVHGVQESEIAKRLALVELAHSSGMEALCEAWLPPMVHPARRSDTAFMEPLRAMIRRSTPMRFEGQIRALLSRADATGLVAASPDPLLICVGRQDEWSPVAQHQEIIAAAEKGRLLVVEDAGHMLPYEAPEAVNGALREWLADESKVS